VDNLRIRFEALSARDQQKILDKHRDIETDHRWWTSIYDQFIMDVNEYGYMVDETHGKDTRHCIWWSGFSSQGDGACFDGRVWNWSVAFKDWPILTEYCKDASVDKWVRWNSKGNYSHEHSLVFDWDIDNSNVYDEKTDRLRWLAMDDMITQATAEWEKFTAHTETQVKELCRDLYIKLEEEYHWLTDDEQVLGCLIANGMLEDELQEYEDDEDEDDEPESTGPVDSRTDHALAGSLFLWETGYALAASGGPDDSDTGS
jgi:hypothetical protein